MKSNARPALCSFLLLLCPFLVALGACAWSGGRPAAAPAPAAQTREHAHDHGPLGHRFENAKEWSKRFDDPARDAWQRPEEVVRLMGIEAGQTVADIGAGTGYFLKRLSRAVGEKGSVLALDIEPDMVRHMSGRAASEGLRNVEARLVPFDDPKLGEGTVHRILIVNTWHHIPDRADYTRKLARALAPGGAVFVVDYTLESKMGPPKEHRIAPGVVAAELRAGGLAAATVDEPLPEQYIVAGRLPSP